jgi:ribosomal protein L37E/uncharacterized damage-inducible protein DinB
MSTDVPSTPTDLIGFAAELEREGQYNAAKLLRAAAEALLLRASTATTPPAEPADQANALIDLAEAMVGTSLMSLADPLRAAAHAIHTGRVALVDDAPDPFVCRICGDVSFDAGRERCAHCGRWATSRELIRPIYWIRESHPPEALDRLRGAPQTIARLLGDPTDPAVRQSPAAGEWSAHQVLEHLHNAQQVFRGRIDQLAAGGEPTLTSVMVWAMAGEDGSTPELLADYNALRKEIVTRLEGLPSATWWNRGRHEEWGTVTLAEQASYFANHEPTHMAQLADAIR